MPDNDRVNLLIQGDATIGYCDWDACDTCENYDELGTPTCKVEKAIPSHLQLEYDYVLCGLYKARANE